MVCNSGNANAVTGDEGLADARRMAELTARAIGAEPEQVAVASTGVIGVRLPMDKVAAGIEKAVAALGRSADAAPGPGGEAETGSMAAATAIMTTDTAPKEIAVEFTLKGRTVRLGGIAKGSGMIHPNMATMLAFITTDAAVTPEALQAGHRRLGGADVQSHHRGRRHQHQRHGAGPGQRGGRERTRRRG